MSLQLEGELARTPHITELLAFNPSVIPSKEVTPFRGCVPPIIDSFFYCPKRKEPLFTRVIYHMGGKAVSPFAYCSQVPLRPEELFEPPRSGGSLLLRKSSVSAQAFIPPTLVF